MTYSTYFDLTLHEYPEIPLWDTLSRVWRIVHVAGASTQQTFAIAFPKKMEKGFSLGTVVRIFTTSEEAANAIYDSIEAAPGIDDLLSKSRIRHVDTANITGYEAYTMKRIAGKLSNALANDPARAEQQAQRILRQKSQQQHLPFVRMRTSKGLLFKLVIEHAFVHPESTGLPNGYGLSRKHDVAALPVLK